MFACKECHQILEVRDGHNCPTGERQPEISREWQGFIEVLDPEKSAQMSPYKTTVAHGFLTLSLTAGLSMSMKPNVEAIQGMAMAINYGLDKVRFISPVKGGARVRMNAVVAEVTEVRGGYQLAVDQTVEVEGGDKPALIAEWLGMQMVGG